MTEFTGHLLYWDHDPRRDRLLIGFDDMDVNDPVWLPAAQVKFRLDFGRFGCGVFLVPSELAAQRPKLRARVLRDQDTDAARDVARPVRRPKFFRPKRKKPAASAPADRAPQLPRL